MININTTIGGLVKATVIKPDGQEIEYNWNKNMFYKDFYDTYMQPNSIYNNQVFSFVPDPNNSRWQGSGQSFDYTGYLRYGTDGRPDTFESSTADISGIQTGNTITLTQSSEEISQYDHLKFDSGELSFITNVNEHILTTKQTHTVAASSYFTVFKTSRTDPGYNQGALLYNGVGTASPISYSTSATNNESIMFSKRFQTGTLGTDYVIREVSLMGLFNPGNSDYYNLTRAVLNPSISAGIGDTVIFDYDIILTMSPAGGTPTSTEDTIVTGWPSASGSSLIECISGGFASDLGKDSSYTKWCPFNGGFGFNAYTFFALTSSDPTVALQFNGNMQDAITHLPVGSGNPNATRIQPNDVRNEGDDISTVTYIGTFTTGVLNTDDIDSIGIASNSTNSGSISDYYSVYRFKFDDLQTKTSTYNLKIHFTKSIDQDI